MAWCRLGATWKHFTSKNVVKMVTVAKNIIKILVANGKDFKPMLPDQATKPTRLRWQVLPQKIHGYNLEKLLHGHAYFAQEFLAGQKQTGGQSRVNQDKGSVCRGVDNAFNPQVLCDFTEEYLDLPAFFVNIGNGFSRQATMLG